MQENSVLNETVSTIISRLERGESLSTAEVMAYQQTERLIPSLISSISKSSSKARRAAIRLFVELGRPRIKSDGDIPERPAPYVNEPAIVKYLIGALSDEEKEVRDRASVALVAEVPDTLLREESEAITRAVRLYPSTEHAALLLGKTGSKDADMLIRTVIEIREANMDETLLALGRLGDRHAEDLFINAYLKTEEPKEKANYARKLGYMATHRSVQILAAEIRTPETYIWQMNSRRSMRVHIIEGLHIAFPTAPVLFPPFFKPEHDSYYEEIEAWLARRLAMKWDRPRPEFLYEEDAPVVPR